MATRSAYDATASTALTATNLDKHAGGWIGFVADTAGQTSITTVVDATNLTLTVTARSGCYHKVTCKVDVSSSVAGDVIELQITDGSNTMTNRAEIVAGAAGTGETLTATSVESGWSGSTTRKARIRRVSGTGTITITATGTAPSFLLIEDLGTV